MARIDALSSKNMQTQGARQREWMRQHAPEHLQQCTTLMLHALHQRATGAAQNTVILGAGACTEIPLAMLVRASDELVLVDLDLAAMQQGYAEIPSTAQRRRVRLVQDDISGGVSPQLARLMRRQDWESLVSQGAQAVFDAAAQCLEQCRITDPPAIQTLHNGEFGLVISSLVLSQLFSYPLLDVLDHIQHIASTLLGEQERHRRYQEAAQAFRIRLIKAHLHLLRGLLDRGGCAVLLTDVRGFVFNVQGTDHDAAHRRTMPLVPRTFPDLIREDFTVVEEAQWEWVTDLPEKERPGRGYEVAGYVLV
ncbi:MAG TPA: hypothetical protein VKR06_05750 [Ktedonosporobacter sp.]|nr:hypothetical protein [Ktedonosporobacter sp.]